MKTLVIINQHTAKRELRTGLLEILDILTKAGWTCTVHPTQSAGDASNAVSPDYDRIVCIGGDGTLNEVVAGLTTLTPGERPPVGYIPAGTTNDFAASLGIPIDPLEAAKRIVSALPRPMDCGRLNGHSFNYIASFGAFTEVSYETPQTLKNSLGHFAYVLEGVAKPGIKPYPIRFTTDNEVMEGEFAFGAFANTRSIGGVIHLNPDQVAFDDGLHEYLLIRMPKNPTELGQIAHELRTGAYMTSRDGMIRFGRFDRGTIDCGAMSWSLDGECVRTEGAVTVENLRHAYQLCY
ncbi:MAG: YegS/Rv2252/BmrU family lipid kinase [Clostridia bacterium]|nr:YegS/Rv2252/BmrU family lipid kinase [Clostridia bacterium]